MIDLTVDEASPAGVGPRPSSNRPEHAQGSAVVSGQGNAHAENHGDAETK